MRVFSTLFDGPPCHESRLDLKKGRVVVLICPGRFDLVKKLNYNIESTKASEACLEQ